MNKKFFEVTEPYFALIRAEDTEEVAKIYQKGVADIEDHEEFRKDIKEISEKLALIMFTRDLKGLDSDRSSEEILKMFDDEDIQVLSIDTALY